VLGTLAVVPNILFHICFVFFSFFFFFKLQKIVKIKAEEGKKRKKAWVASQGAIF